MALSDTRKKNIIADYKTGAFSLNKLAKKHKISTNTVKKICTDVNHDNAPLVEALYEVENLKNCTKNAQEIKAVENVVKDRLKITNISNKLLDKIDNFIDKNKAVKVITEGQGMGVSMARVIEHDLQSSDFKNIADTIHKTGQTLGVVNDKPDIAIQNNNIIEIEIE